MEMYDRSQEYLNKREDGEVNLFDFVAQQFIQYGIPDNIVVVQDYFMKNDLMDRKPNVQKFYLNKFFTTQLLMSEKNSIEQRYCLITDGTIEDWAKLFKNKIMPFLVENNLPRFI